MSDTAPGLGERRNIVDIEGVERCADPVVQAVVLQGNPVGLGRGCESTRHGDAKAAEIAYHFAQ